MTGRQSVSAVAAVLVIGACGPPQAEAPSAKESPSIRATSLAERPPLPAGFPVLPGAAVEPMPEDDRGLIGLWRSERVGSAAYDFYLDALPAAGYAIIGRYPGGEVALIRFSLPDGATWQVVARSDQGGTVIEVRLDRP